jgi:hypothetical protein
MITSYDSIVADVMCDDLSGNMIEKVENFNFRNLKKVKFREEKKRKNKFE